MRPILFPTLSDPDRIGPRLEPPDPDAGDVPAPPNTAGSVIGGGRYDPPTLRMAGLGVGRHDRMRQA